MSWGTIAGISPKTESSPFDGTESTDRGTESTSDFKEQCAQLLILDIYSVLKVVQLFKNKKNCKVSLTAHDPRKCAEFYWANLLIFAQISRNIHKSCFHRKCLGIITRKSINFRFMIPGNKLISGYCYSEINLFLGNNTRK